MESHDPTVVNPRPAGAYAPPAQPVDLPDQQIDLNDGVILEDIVVSIADPDCKRIATGDAQTVEIDIPIFGAKSAAGNPANQVIDDITADAYLSKIANAKKVPKAAVEVQVEVEAEVEVRFTNQVEAEAVAGGEGAAATSDPFSSI